MKRWQHVDVFAYRYKNERYNLRIEDQTEERFQKAVDYIHIFKPEFCNYTQRTHTGSSSGYLDPMCIRIMDIGNAFSVIALEFFQFGHPFGSVKPFAEIVSASGVELFCGKWRNEYVDEKGKGFTSDELRQSNTWVGEYQKSLLCALLLDNKKDWSQLAGWPGDDVFKGELDHSTNDIDFLIVHANFLKGISLSQNPEFVDRIRCGKKRRPKMLLEILEAIEKKDVKATVKTFEKYEKYFNKSEYNPEEDNYIEGNICMYGSILWNTAKVLGVEIPITTEEIADRIVTPQSIGLEK